MKITIDATPLLQAKLTTSIPAVLTPVKPKAWLVNQLTVEAGMAVRL